MVSAGVLVEVLVLVVAPAGSSGSSSSGAAQVRVGGRRDDGELAEDVAAVAHPDGAVHVELGQRDGVTGAAAAKHLSAVPKGGK